MIERANMHINILVLKCATKMINLLSNRTRLRGPRKCSDLRKWSPLKKIEKRCYRVSRNITISLLLKLARFVNQQHKLVGRNPLSKVFFHTTFQEFNLHPSSGEGFVVITTVFFYYSSLAVTGIRTRELFRSSVLWITSPER